MNKTRSERGTSCIKVQNLNTWVKFLAYKKKTEIYYTNKGIIY